MSDQQEKPADPSNVPKPSTVPAGATAPAPPTSPVKIMKDWFSRARKPSSKSKNVLKQIKSHQFVATGGCKLNMAMLPDDIAVLTTENEGDQLFKKTVGTKSSAKKNTSSLTPHCLT